MISFFRSVTLAALLIVLALPAQGKPKDKNGNSLEQTIESLTGVDIPKQKGKKNQPITTESVMEVLNPQNNSPSRKKKNSSNNLEPFDAIREYIFGYRKNNNSKGLPPGLAKKEARGQNLPPGWQKKVYPGATFPNDLFGYTSLLNYSQVPRAKNPGPGVDFYSIGNRIFKMNRSDNRILDVMDYE